MLADSTMRRLTVDPEWADSLRALPDYTYTEAGPSLFDRFMNWFFGLVQEVMDGRGDSLVDFIGYAVIITLLVVMVMVLLRRGQSPLQRVLRGDVRANDGELLEAEDLDRLIGTAVHEGRYRHAVRFLYLRSLADLRDANIIVWQVDKTDSDYVREVRGSWEHAEAFAAAVRNFQYHWYGEHPVDEAAFSAVYDQFNQLRRLS